MSNVTQVGLDVHRDSTAVAVLRPGILEPDEWVIPSTPEAYRKLVRRFDAGTVVCYEAGPCGYAPYRTFTSLGVRCEVIAPSLIPRRPGDRVKTDRLDARRLARLHRAGELTTIRVPTPAEEAARDVVRVREDLKEDRRRTIQRIKAFVLRHGQRFPNPRGFSGRHEAFARSLRFDLPHAQAAFDQLLGAYDTRTAQLRAMDRQLDELATQPPLAELVARLRTLRGIDTLSAVIIAAEVCDLRQFRDARAFMAYCGLVPSEHSSGERTRRGSITKTGNAHLRRVLVEAAWAYRHRPHIGAPLARRQQGQPPEVVAYSWKAQTRLHDRFRRIAATKNRNVAVVAVARELAGFIWGIGTNNLN
jgi:transposase